MLRGISEKNRGGSPRAHARHGLTVDDSRACSTFENSLPTHYIKNLDSRGTECDARRTPSGINSTASSAQCQEEIMSGRERRISPRKDCMVPLRFRVLSNGASAREGEIAASYEIRGPRSSAYHATLAGEALNLSERGVYFTSREELSVGAPLEMYFTLPRELTGRNPEPIRCSARVVHVEQYAGQRGLLGIGATVERFEAVPLARNWDN
jgi:hypothetical protein